MGPLFQGNLKIRKKEASKASQEIPLENVK